MAFVQTLIIVFFFFNLDFSHSVLTGLLVSHLSPFQLSPNDCRCTSDHAPPLLNSHELPMVFVTASYPQSRPSEEIGRPGSTSSAPTLTTQPEGQVSVSPPSSLSPPCGLADPSASSHSPETSPLRGDREGCTFYLLHQHPECPCVKAFISRSHRFFACPIGP